MKTSSIKYLRPNLLLISPTGCMDSPTHLNSQHDSHIMDGSAQHGPMTFTEQPIPQRRIRTQSNRIFKFIKMKGIETLRLLAKAEGEQPRADDGGRTLRLKISLGKRRLEFCG